MTITSTRTRPFTWVYRWDTSYDSYRWIRRPVSTPVVDIDDILDENFKDMYEKYNAKKPYSVFTKPIALSNELCEFIDIPPNSLLSRSDVTKYICNYAKDHGLLDKQNIRADESLLKLFPTLRKNNDLKILNLQKYLKTHYRMEFNLVEKILAIRKTQLIKQELKDRVVQLKIPRIYE